MIAGDLQKNNAMGMPYQHAAMRVAIAIASRHGSRWARMLVIILAVVFVRAAKAQSPAPPQTQSPPQTQTPPQSQAAPPAQTSSSAPATTTNESTGRVEGNYTVQQTIEFGYRDSMMGGNLNNYDTFENLSSGLRLFDYSVDMRSINHQGLFFDNLSFSNFGYGGDPDDVSRLRVDRNKWYDFRGMFRRDKNFWNYNLLANPLNPVGAIVPNPAITSSPHALDLSRRMQDYDLTLLPQSRLRFRLGYARNVNSGPALSTLEGGTEPLLTENLNDVTNSYRMGADYRGLKKTTLSFDELLTYTAVNETVVDNNRLFQLSSGAAVDLGIVFVGTSPCAKPITNAASVPPTVTANCNGYLSYSQVQNPRSSFPTERFSFQSTYFRNLSMTGSAAYSSGTNTVSGFNDAINGFTTRTLARVSTTGGPAQANRISANANWSGDYRVTDKLNIIDEFSYNNWRIPSLWTTSETNLYGTPPQNPSQVGLLLPVSMVTPATFASICPVAPYNGPNCPQHNSSSLADVTNELVSQFLGQNIRSNTFEVKYDFTNRLGGYLGYAYTARAIEDFSATFDTGEIYFPGGPGGNVGNDFFAARGDCALVAGKLPSGCTLNANGSIQEGSSTNLVAEAGNDTARNVYDIHENVGLFGISARPIDSLRLNADLMFGYNDNSFTRVSPRQIQSYKVSARYTPKAWANVGATVDINENRDNVFTVNNVEHARAYSLVTTLSPSSSLWIDFGYSYMDVYTQTEICFPDTGSTVFTTPCPVPGASSPLGTLSYYSSHDNYVYGNLMWKPQKRVTAMAGYGASIVRGNTTFLNPLTPTGTLDFNYSKPFASLAIDIYRGLAYKTAWNYYGYSDHGVANPAGLAALPSQDFNGNNVTFSLRYAF